GLFSISAPQTNGAGSSLNVQAGNFNLFSDAGSTSSRTLTINSSANTFLGVNEHLAALNVGSGLTTVGQNGSRVLATNALSTGGGTFSGQAVDGTAILVKYTYYGDANLSGNVDTIDFNILTANFSKTPRIWSDADFDYSQTVDTIDFNQLAGNFSKTGLAPAAA